MRLPVFLLCFGLFGGCASRHRVAPATAALPPATAKTNQNVIVTPGRAMSGRVAAVNSAGRFVVLSFPLGSMPPLEKRLNVYRGGLKVGEVKVSGPQLDINIDADIVAGECQPGDEVRED